MNFLQKKLARIARRLKLATAALFYKSRNLDAVMAQIQKPRDFDLRGWGNPFDVLHPEKTWNTSLPPVSTLSRDEQNHVESSEADVISLLYDLGRSINAKMIVEVGIYHGAGSLGLARSLADNAGGDLHLVDVSPAYLSDVQNKIEQQQWPVNIHTHCLDAQKSLADIGLPPSDLIFIDANHNYEYAKKDIAVCWPLIKQGGFLVLHDTVKHEGTRRSAMELHQQGHPVCTLATSHGSGTTVLRKT